MDKEILRNIIEDQHRMIKEMEFVKRDYYLDDNMCYVLVGIRRAGKSTLLYSKVKEYINKGIDWSQIIYINFEDDRLVDFSNKDFQDIINLKNELTDKKGYYFFDEIQNVDGWVKFARRMADYNEIVYITGSNSKMLSSEISSKLGGRYISKYIMPYDINEYLLANNIVDDHSSIIIGRINEKINSYLNNGGLPQTINLLDKREYISSVYNKVLLNDVLLHNNIRNEQSLKVLVKKLAENVKEEISYSRFYNIMKSIGYSISKDTIIDYISYIKEANLIFDVTNFYYSFVEREASKKYYFVDNGILNLFLLDKKGTLLENMVASLLKRRGKEFYFLKSSKTGIDIDFYIPDENTVIQVAYSISEYQAKEREINELIKIAKNSKEKNRLVIITYDENELINVDNNQIEVISLYNYFKKM